jgi:hypothetical protein
VNRTTPAVPLARRSLAVAVLLALVATLVTVAPPLPPADASTPTGTAGVLADYDGEMPEGHFVFAGGASSVTPEIVTIGAEDADARPAQVGDNGVLQVDHSIGDYGGFGQEFTAVGPQDWSATDGFRFWFKGEDSGRVYTVELSGARSDPATDTSTRYNTTFTDDVAGWRLIELPWSAFALSDGHQQPGAPLDPDLTLDEIWAWAFVLPAGAGTFLLDDVGILPPRADDFEYATLPSGTDGSATIGFSTFNDPSSSASIALESTPPAPVLPHLGPDNQVLRMDLNVASFAGFAHAFTDGTSWTPQDWSANAGFGFWFHGDGDRTTVFIDVLGARNDGSTTDDAQRWTVDFVDDTAGWSFRSWDFSELRWKNINNGAPAGNVFEPAVVHGWAVGTLGTGGPRTFYVDDLVLLGSGADRPLTVSLGSADVRVTEGETAVVPVRLSRPLREDEGPVTVSYATEAGSAVPGRTYDDVEGTLTFVEDGPTEQSFSVTTYDDAKRNHDRTIITRLSGSPLLVGAQGRITVLDDEVADPTLLDDVERTVHEFDASTPSSPGSSSPRATARPPGPGPLRGGPRGRRSTCAHPRRSRRRAQRVAIDPSSVSVRGACRNAGNGVVQVVVHGSDELAGGDDHVHSSIRVGDASETHVDPRTGQPSVSVVTDVDRDGSRRPRRARAHARDRLDLREPV